jgi:hypothetical protein
MFVPTVTALVPAVVLIAAARDHTDDIRTAGKDVAKLLELARSWSSAGDERAACAAWSRVLDLDAQNEEAHKGLRHHAYAGRWFETYGALYRHRREEEQRMLAEKGLVRFRDGWVPEADLRYVALGFDKDADGAWCNPATLARLQREKELVAQGWQQQDLTWVPPAEFDSWRKGLWKCGDRWLDKAAANAHHAQLASWWEVPGEHFVVCSTLDRDSVDWAKWYADQTYRDLVRIFGVEPGREPSTLDLLGTARDKPTVVVLADMDQYNAFAAGSTEERRAPTELEGFSSLHYAFFASTWFEPRDGAATHRGCGVAFWARNDTRLAGYGQHAIRHAAAQSYIEAIDPSFGAVGASGGNVNAFQNAAFWNEKRIPRWLRYGAASYCERYFIDDSGKNTGDTRWARKWGFANLEGAGGVGSLETLFAFGLTLDDIPASTKLIHDAGAVVAYLLDGGDAKVVAAHEALRRALAEGADTSKSVEALHKALLASERELRKFARP